jgi:hypothetical protein
MCPECNRIHKHAQCVNLSEGITYPHSRACPLILTSEKRKMIGILFICYFFSWVSYCHNRQHVFIFAYDTKEKKTSKHLAIRKLHISMLFLLLVYLLFSLHRLFLQRSWQLQDNESWLYMYLDFLVISYLKICLHFDEMFYQFSI